MNNTTIIISIIIMAVITYATRVIPLVLCRKKIKNKYLRSFLLYMPFGVLSAMIFPAILYSTDLLLSAIVGMAVALVLSFFNKGLLPVAFFSCLSVFATEQLVKLIIK